MDVSIYVNHLINLVLSIIVQNQGNNVGGAIKCGQVLSKYRNFSSKWREFKVKNPPELPTEFYNI